MEYDSIRKDYLDLRRRRLEHAARKSRLGRRQIEEFELLEDWMNSGKADEDWLRSFQLSNDDYLRLLEKVLRALVTAREPHAREKLGALIEEKGIMMPAVYHTPWDLTLAHLDQEYGDFEDVAAFY